MIPRIKFAVGIAIILLQLWLYINADYVYGPYASIVKNVMLAYFILLALLSPFVIQILMDIGFQDVPNFSIGFVITAIVMFAIGSITVITGEIEGGLTLVLGFGLLHSFVKAFNEEVIFRGVLPKLIGGTMVADVVSSIVFGVFHVAVTGASWYAIIFLSILGFIWSQMRRYIGVMGTTGSHFAYNLSALGVLPKLLGGG